MPRFFVSPDAVSGTTARLVGENANHCHVLRLRPGEEICLCDGQGQDYLCRIAALEREQVLLSVMAVQPSLAEPRVDVSIYMALSKADKFEHVIQKATELGANRIVAYPSRRAVARLDAKAAPKKLERWQRIAESAAKQSGRGRIPQVACLLTWQEALEQARQAELPLFFYESADPGQSLRARLQGAAFRTLSLMTGPEGGYAPEEVQQADQAGLQVCSLGSRILRCETAPLCALSAVMFHCGEL